MSAAAAYRWWTIRHLQEIAGLPIARDPQSYVLSSEWLGDSRAEVA
jgi:hypothetical protein